MEIKYVKIGELKLYANNPKQHPEEQVQKIARSIQTFGFRVPVIVTSDYEVVAGHGRVLAAKHLGLKEVPCIIISDLTPEQIKAFRVADNKVTESDWDYDLLRINIRELIDAQFDIALLGFDRIELDDLLQTNSDDDGFNGDDVDDESVDEFYTQKTQPVVYVPQRKSAPALGLLLDETKANELLAKIDAANVPEEVKQFLRKAATRFYRFDYREIAEYYAHADAATQELMEDLALVIIDIDKAIQKGFVRAEGYMQKLWRKERGS